MPAPRFADLVGSTGLYLPDILINLAGDYLRLVQRAARAKEEAGWSDATGRADEIYRNLGVLHGTLHDSFILAAAAGGWSHREASEAYVEFGETCKAINQRFRDACTAAHPAAVVGSPAWLKFGADLTALNHAVRRAGVSVCAMSDALRGECSPTVGPHGRSLIAPPPAAAPPLAPPKFNPTTGIVKAVNGGMVTLKGRERGILQSLIASGGSADTNDLAEAVGGKGSVSSVMKRIARKLNEIQASCVSLPAQCGSYYTTVRFSAARKPAVSTP